MTAFVALLCAVNVGGTGKLAMADLRRLLAGLGYGRVETYIRSGNAVFHAKGTGAGVAKAIAAALEAHMGAPMGVVVRTHEELERVIAANPFGTEAATDGARVHAVFLAGDPAKNAVAGLEQIAAQYPARRDRFHLDGKTLYLHLPDGAADTKFTTKTLNRVLGVASTARNWNTVGKLWEMSRR